MRLTVRQEDFHRGLAAVVRAAPFPKSIPVTGNILLEASGGRLTLTATDAETLFIAYAVDAEVEEDGAIALPSRLLHDFIAEILPGRVNLALNKGSSRMSIACARNEASIKGRAAEEFPPLPPADGGTDIPFRRAVLRRSIGLVDFAAATDDTRPALSGVHFSIRGGTLRLAAADGFRLAVSTTDLPDADSPEREAVVPARALGELVRLLGEGGGAGMGWMTFNEAATQVLFDLGHARLGAQLVQAPFPGYEQLIPDGPATLAEAGREEFEHHARSASIFARDGSGAVRLAAVPGGGGAIGRITVSAQGDPDGDGSGVSEGLIGAMVEGAEAKTALNARYLVDVLRKLDCGRVKIGIGFVSDPVAVRPAAGGDDYVHVLMPMFVQW